MFYLQTEKHIPQIKLLTVQLQNRRAIEILQCYHDYCFLTLKTHLRRFLPKKCLMCKRLWNIPLLQK